MIRLFLLLIFSVPLFSHSILEHMESTEDENLSYGIYSDAAYRDKDLYPRGIEGSVGYENHGRVEKLQIHHIGLYLDATYDTNFLYGFEFNRHIDADDTFDEYLEKAYLGYGTEDYKVLLGRYYDDISFVNQKAWGYGFAQMPLAIDSFFDSTYISDGIFLNYSFMGITAYLDFSQDKYYQTSRRSFKLEYNADKFQFITYMQLRKKIQMRIDYASVQHNHTHGNTDGCNNLGVEERCFERENKVFGLGIDANIKGIKIQSEYIYLDTEGYVSSSQYRVESENKIHTFYLQMLYNYNDILFGLRSEWFAFSNNYEGGGATEVANVIISEDSNDIQNLQTIMSGYRFNRYHQLIVQGEHSGDEWVGRLNYSVKFTSSD